jgi:hypothetical protein
MLPEILPDVAYLMERGDRIEDEIFASALD